MSVLVNLCDREGETAGHVVLLDVVPRIGETVAFKTTAGEYEKAKVLDVHHAVHFEQDRHPILRDPSSSARIYIYLDRDKDGI